jgi:crotonobetainyl-CoA:carnitine CoA-transferase CaiB-like acyl-CoA transferase
LGTVRQLAGLVRAGNFEPVQRRGPLLGEHTAEVLRDLLGLGEVQLEELAAADAFGPEYRFPSM